MASLYPLIPIASGLVLLAFLFRHLRLSARLAVYGAYTEGEIVGYHETSTKAKMVVRFRTDEGREVRATHTSTGWTASRSGDIVTVSYDPTDPQRARIVRAPWLSHWVRTMFAVLGFSLVAIGALLGAVAWS